MNRKLCSIFVLFFLSFPSLASAGWIYVDSSQSTTMQWYAPTGSYWVSSTGLTSGVWTDSGLTTTSYISGSNITNIIPLGLPAPSGYFTQAEYDAATSGSGTLTQTDIDAAYNSGFVDGAGTGAGSMTFAEGADIAWAVVGASLIAVGFGLMRKAV